MAVAGSEDADARLRRCLLALHDARRQLRLTRNENLALRQELEAAGQMIDDLASELELAQTQVEALNERQVKPTEKHE